MLQKILPLLLGGNVLDFAPGEISQARSELFLRSRLAWLVYTALAVLIAYLTFFDAFALPSDTHNGAGQEWMALFQILSAQGMLPYIHCPRCSAFFTGILSLLSILAAL